MREGSARKNRENQLNLLFDILCRQQSFGGNCYLVNLFSKAITKRFHIKSIDAGEEYTGINLAPKEFAFFNEYRHIDESVERFAW